MAPVSESLRQPAGIELTLRKEAWVSSAVRVNKMSAYQAQFGPSNSSTGTPRPLISMRAACAQQLPGPLRIAGIVVHHHRCTAGAAVASCTGQKVTLALATQTERRRDDGLPHHRQMVQRVLKAQRESHHQPGR